jgi:hypothetical protein
MAQDQVPQFVGQGAVPGRQPVLDEEDIVIGVLPPLSAHARRKVGHGDLDRPALMLADGGDQPAQRHLALSGSQIEHVVDRLGDLATGRHLNPFPSRLPARWGVP